MRPCCLHNSILCTCLWLHGLWEQKTFPSLYELSTLFWESLWADLIVPLHAPSKYDTLQHWGETANVAGLYLFSPLWYSVLYTPTTLLFLDSQLQLLISTTKSHGENRIMVYSVILIDFDELSFKNNLIY